MFHAASRVRITKVLGHVGIASSSWYRQQPAGPRKRPGPKPKVVAPELEQAIVQMATNNPWYGYQRIAVMCRRSGTRVNNREVYQIMRAHKLLHRPRPRVPELHQASKLFELLPEKPNDLWQSDVTYIHIPGFGWRYAVTVIDYYSRYLLACYLTSSYAAVETTHGLRLAREEAERLHGKLTHNPVLVTDNGSSFIAKRYAAYLKDRFRHVRIAYRTPTQLGLLERFHRTLKEEEVYWQLYDSPSHARECLSKFRTRYNEQRPHWALAPELGGDPYVPQEVYVEGKRIAIPRWQTWARAAKAKIEALAVEAAA